MWSKEDYSGMFSGVRFCWALEFHCTVFENCFILNIFISLKMNWSLHQPPPSSFSFRSVPVWSSSVYLMCVTIHFESRTKSLFFVCVERCDTSMMPCENCTGWRTGTYFPCLLSTRGVWITFWITCVDKCELHNCIMRHEAFFGFFFNYYFFYCLVEKPSVFLLPHAVALRVVCLYLCW